MHLLQMQPKQQGLLQPTDQSKDWKSISTIRERQSELKVMVGELIYEINIIARPEGLLEIYNPVGYCP